MISQVKRLNNRVGLRNPCKETVTAFVSDQVVEAVVIYRAKMIGSVPVQDQGVATLAATAEIAERRLPSLPSNSAKFASARLVYSNHKITHRRGLFLLRIKRKQIGDLLL